MDLQRRQLKKATPTRRHPRGLSPQNRRLLAFLERFRKTPDEMGDAWWDEFRDFLKKNPVRLGESELG
jgi:hypothetical protein